MDWIATILSIAGIVLNANKLMICWPVWLASNVLWIIYSINAGETAALVMWIVFVGFNGYGWYKWKQDEKTDED